LPEQGEFWVHIFIASYVLSGLGLEPGSFFLSKPDAGRLHFGGVFQCADNLMLELCRTIAT
jgi:hypothetical protein